MSQTLEAPQTRSPRANFIYAEAETRTRTRSDNATTPRNNPKGSRASSEHALQRATACTLNYDLIRI